MEKLTETQLSEHLKALPGWEFQQGAIAKSFRFNDFKEAFAIMTRIAFECELQHHHPNWENVYNSLSIRLNTHDVGGITLKDITLAKTIEAIVSA